MVKLDKTMVPDAEVWKEMEFRSEIFWSEEITYLLTDEASVLDSPGMELDVDLNDVREVGRYLSSDAWNNVEVALPISVINTRIERYERSPEDQKTMIDFTMRSYGVSEERALEMRGTQDARYINCTKESLVAAGVKLEEYPMISKLLEKGGELTITGTTFRGVTNIEHEPFYLLESDRYEASEVVQSAIDQLDALLEKELERLEDFFDDKFQNVGDRLSKRLTKAYEADTDEDFIREYLAEEPENWIDNYPDLLEQLEALDGEVNPADSGPGDILGRPVQPEQDVAH